MSLYCERFYEVCLPDIDAEVCNESELVDDAYPDGYTVSVTHDFDYPYRVWDIAMKRFHKVKEVECKWRLVKWLTDSKNSYHIGRWDVRVGDINKQPGETLITTVGTNLSENVLYMDCDEYVIDKYASNYSEVGLPEDASDELRKIADEYPNNFSPSFVYFSQLLSDYDDMKKEFVDEIIRHKTDALLQDINTKVDCIINGTKPKKNKKNKISSLEYEITSKLSDLESVYSEIEKIRFLLDTMRYVTPDKVRVIYNLT